MPENIDTADQLWVCFALADSFAQSAEPTPWILSKIFLAGLHDLVYFTRLSWACVRVFNRVLEL